MSVRSTGRLLRRWRGEARRTSGWGGLLYVLPALSLLILFQVWPPIFGLWISLWEWGIRPIRFVGLANYERMFLEGFVTRDFTGQLVVGEVLGSLIVSFYYVVGTVPTGILLAFVLAYLLQRLVGRRLRAVLRPVYFVPVVISSAAVALVFSWIFDPRVGIANAALAWAGFPEQTWLQDPEPFVRRATEAFGGSWPGWWPGLFAGPSTALVVVMLFTIWSNLGFNVIVYLAGLATVPTELYDAAKVDGAGRLDIMRRITWPLLLPTTLFLSVYNTVVAFQAFTPVFTLTRGSGTGTRSAGGPLDTTLTMPVYIFRNFYERTNSVGYAAAVSFLLFAIIFGLTLLQFRWLGKRAGR